MPTGMPPIVNVAKARLVAGKVAFGLGVRFSRSIDIARGARSAGYHYLFIDMEHSTIDISTAGQICIAGLDVGVTPIVRVPEREHALATRMLDGGAQGIVVPHVSTASQARDAVAMYKYPPLGHRSSGGSSVQLAWQSVPLAEQNRLLNASLLLVVMLETPEAIDNVEAIAAVEGIDVLSVGSNDLAAEMGITGEFGHPRLLAAYDSVLAAARRNGKQVRLGGIYDMAMMKDAVRRGARMMMLGNDFGILMDGLRAKQKSMAGFLAPDLL